MVADSTGAAAALVATTIHPDSLRAIVCRGGRPDLAGEARARVKVPVLLLVGEFEKYLPEGRLKFARA